MKPPIIQITEEKSKLQQDFIESPMVAIKNDQIINQEERRSLYIDLVKDSPRTSLPKHFNVRYLGMCPTDGLWGVEHTQKQVEAIIKLARQSRRSPSPIILSVAEAGVTLSSHNESLNGIYYPIESVSYGAQDMIYTRVFALITIIDSDDTKEKSPFQCHAFACDSADVVHQLTHSLAESFKRFAAAQDAQLAKKPTPDTAVNVESEESDA